MELADLSNRPKQSKDQIERRRVLKLVLSAFLVLFGCMGIMLLSNLQVRKYVRQAEPDLVRALRSGDVDFSDIVSCDLFDRPSGERIPFSEREYQNRPKTRLASEQKDELLGVLKAAKDPETRILEGRPSGTHHQGLLNAMTASGDVYHVYYTDHTKGRVRRVELYALPMNETHPYICAPYESMALIEFLRVHRPSPGETNPGVG